MLKLKPDNLPPALVSLIPIAEKWGSNDDFARNKMVKEATPEELSELIHSIDSISDDDLYGWLSGPESYNPNPSIEYLAVTCLTMAIDMAKLRERREK